MGFRVAWGWVLCGVVAIATVGGMACGGGTSDNGFGDGTDGGDGDASLADDGGTNVHFDTGAGDASSALLVSPQNVTLDVNAGGAAVTQQYTATRQGSQSPVAANWSMDTPALGKIDGTGLFTASGKAGGTATITAQSGNDQGQAKVTVRLHIAENPGNIDPGTQGTLKGGGTADPPSNGSTRTTRRCSRAASCRRSCSSPARPRPRSTCTSRRR